MAIALDSLTAPKAATLATTMQIVTVGGTPASAALLQVTWANDAQSAENIVYLELNTATEGGAVGANAIALHPGSAYRTEPIVVHGCSSVGLAGSSIFDVTTRLIRL
jgi:hypothetical protein